MTSEATEEMLLQAMVDAMDAEGEREGNWVPIKWIRSFAEEALAAIKALEPDFSHTTPVDSVDAISETIWRAELKRAGGKERSVPWSEVAPHDQERYHHIARSLLATMPAAATSTDAVEDVEAVALVEVLRTSWMSIRSHKQNGTHDVQPVWDIINKVPHIIAILERHGEFERDIKQETLVDMPATATPTDAVDVQISKNINELEQLIPVWVGKFAETGIIADSIAQSLARQVGIALINGTALAAMSAPKEPSQ